MIRNLLNNWKTTSAGLIAIIAAAVTLIFAIKNGTANETVWTGSLTAVVSGLGLLFAGDATQSTKQMDQAKEQVKAAIDTQDSSRITTTADTKAEKL